MAEILLIDDDEELRLFLKSALTERGHDLHSLDRADRALEVLAEGEFDLIIVDEIMPGLNGSEFIKVLRRQGNDIPVILMTALGTRSLIEPMRQLGAMVVTKPAAGSAELLKDLTPAVDELLKGEAEIVELISRTVHLGLKLGKSATELHELLHSEFNQREGAGPPESVIRLVAETWHLHYEGETGDYPNLQALGWLQKLLTAPQKFFTVADLRGDPDRTYGADAGIGTEARTDAAGLKKYKNRLDDIEYVGSTKGWTELLENEKAKLEKLLAEAAKSMESPLRDGHRNIATQIRNFRARLKRTSMPRLATHLRATLKLDFPTFGYFPPPGTSAWQI
jgi:CheY-like chemotaxis protein